MLILAVAGRKGSGKTYLIENIIRHFSGRIKVVAIKHAHHKGLDVDKVGSDTWRFKEAGARAVIGVSSNKLFLNMDVEADDLGAILGLVESLMPNVDLVLIEGYHAQVKRLAGAMKILVSRSLSEAMELVGGDDVLDKRSTMIYCEGCEVGEVEGLKVFSKVADVLSFLEGLVEGRHG